MNRDVKPASRLQWMMTAVPSALTCLLPSAVFNKLFT